MPVWSRRFARLCLGVWTFFGACAASANAQSADYAELDRALIELAREGSFSGAVVIRDGEEVRFAQGYGLADPFTNRAFTPAIPVDSASIAKPVTAALVLDLVAHGRIELDSPVRRYLPEFPDEVTTVGHLLAHSAGLPFRDSQDALVDARNEVLLLDYAASGSGPDFPPGTAFEYCNLCYTTLALLIERVTGRGYLDEARQRARLPRGISIRPGPLARWNGRAIGYRPAPGGPQLHDSFEGELLYGAANLSVSALQLAEWGAAWLRHDLDATGAASAPALIAGKPSGLSWGNWYCAPDRRACHYPGHHQGFHHMLYRDSAGGIVIALVSNNTLAPRLQQRLQRAVVAFAHGKNELGARDLQTAPDKGPLAPGEYAFDDGTTVTIEARDAPPFVERAGLRYRVYPLGEGIGYAPGLDAYVEAGVERNTVHMLTLYDDRVGSLQN